MSNTYTDRHARDTTPFDYLSAMAADAERDEQAHCDRVAGCCQYLLHNVNMDADAKRHIKALLAEHTSPLSG